MMVLLRLQYAQTVAGGLLPSLLLLLLLLLLPLLLLLLLPPLPLPLLPLLLLLLLLPLDEREDENRPEKKARRAGGVRYTRTYHTSSRKTTAPAPQPRTTPTWSCVMGSDRFGTISVSVAPGGATLLPNVTTVTSVVSGRVTVCV